MAIVQVNRVGLITCRSFDFYMYKDYDVVNGENFKPFFQFLSFIFIFNFNLSGNFNFKSFGPMAVQRNYFSC